MPIAKVPVKSPAQSFIGAHGNVSAQAAQLSAVIKKGTGVNLSKPTQSHQYYTKQSKKGKKQGRPKVKKGNDRHIPTSKLLFSAFLNERSQALSSLETGTQMKPTVQAAPAKFITKNQVLSQPQAALHKATSSGKRSVESSKN